MPRVTTGQRVTRYVRTLALLMGSGAVAGELCLGVGGRLAMRVLALTSDDAVTGAFSDDGFEIGNVSLNGTLFLLAVVGIGVGAGGGLLIGAVRPFLPHGALDRALVSGVIGAAVALALLVKPSGIDFSVLGPTWLAVTLFALLGFAYAFVASALIDRWRPFYETATLRSWRVLAFLPMALLPILVPALLASVVIGVGIVAMADRRPPPAVVRIGSAVVAVGALLIAFDGASGIKDIERRDPRPADYIEPDFD